MRTDRLFTTATAPGSVPTDAPGSVPSPAPSAPTRSPFGEDPFARQAGPDVVLSVGGADVRVYTHFSVDPETHEVKVAIVDQAGRLLRMIPPRSVAQMLEAMNSYGVAT